MTDHPTNAMFFGLCETCHTPREVLTQTIEGNAMSSLFCPTCGPEVEHTWPGFLVVCDNDPEPHRLNDNRRVCENPRPAREDQP